MDFSIRNTKRRNNPNWIFDGFDQRDGQGSQYFSNDTFHRPPVTSTQTLIGTEKYPDSGILLNYNNDDYSQAYGKIKEAFKALTKVGLFNPCITDHDFRSS